jgi:hypothetical protein
MKFHEYKTLYERRLCVPSGIRFARYDIEEFYRHFMAIAVREMDRGDLAGIARGKSLVCEYEWLGDHRPYYKLWPAILKYFAGFRLDVPCQAISSVYRAIAVRCPDIHSPLTLTAMLLGAHNRDGDQGFTITAQTREDPLADTRLTMLLPSGTTVEEELAQLKTVDLGLGEARPASPEIIAMMRVAVAVRLLEHDPSVVQPDVLAADRRRFDESMDPEERARLLAKAIRRGVVGWRIGEAYEVCPHYRRPHFALFHTGPGRTIPKILPVRGTIVHRSKVTDVPTGIMSEDGQEIEPAPSHLP